MIEVIIMDKELTGTIDDFDFLDEFSIGAMLPSGYNVSDTNNEFFVDRFTNTILESSTSPLIHLSDKNRNGSILKPRIPSNFLTNNGFEDNKIPRVSLARNIDDALVAISNNLEDRKFYVHEIINSPKLIIPSIRQVPDVKITNEVWATDPVELKCIGYIKVGKAIDKPLRYKLGANSVEAYRWNYSFHKI